MTTRRLAGLALIACLLAPRVFAGDATLFRVFLKNGATLVSYGEFARVGSRVVFSMPTASTSGADEVPLHIVDLRADEIDWAQTNKYAESARAAHYIATRAEADYAALSSQVAATLNDVGRTTDAGQRAAIVEQARKALADWPIRHYFYRSAEVRQMLSLLDEAIANLRASSGSDRFDLSLVAYTVPPVYEPLLPPPTPKEAIEQTLMAARLSDSPAERVSLLTAVVSELNRDAAALPADWAAATRAETTAAIDTELETDRSYRTLATHVLGEAEARARVADVHGLERVIASLRARDTALGGKRPDVVNSLVAAVQERLAAARRLQLVREHWALRMPVLHQYQSDIRAPLALFAHLTPELDDIKSMAGSTPDDLDDLRRTARRIQTLASRISPPEELREAHSLLVSAAQLADSAAQLRLRAAISGDMAHAWNASSAAAGALMLISRTREELQHAFVRPRLSEVR